MPSTSRLVKKYPHAYELYADLDRIIPWNVFEYSGLDLTKVCPTEEFKHLIPYKEPWCKFAWTRRFKERLFSQIKWILGNDESQWIYGISPSHYKIQDENDRSEIPGVFHENTQTFIASWHFMQEVAREGDVYEVREFGHIEECQVIYFDGDLVPMYWMEG